MRVKYNWHLLKSDFITGKWLNVSSFCHDQGIPHNSYARKQTTGWLAEKRQFTDNIMTETLTKVAESEVDTRLRQAAIAKQLQEQGQEGLERFEPQTFRESMKMLIDGLREERAALGLDGKSGPSMNLTQVNLQPNVPTWVDKALENATYEETLEFLAQIKMEKERRVKSGTSSGM